MSVQPDQQQSISIITRNFTLSAGVAVQILAANGTRRYLFIQNTGIGGPFTVKEDSAPVAGGGISMDPPSVAGGQGGSWNPTEVVPTNAFWAISTAGTTITVIEG